MNLGTIRDDLKTRLATISGLQTYDTVPAKPEVPCAIVQPQRIDPHPAYDRGTADVRFSVMMLVQSADWPSAQDALDGYCNIGSSTSVVDALELAAGGTEDVTVDQIDNYGVIQYGEVQFGTVTFNVVVRMSS